MLIMQLHGASRIFTELNGAIRCPGNFGIRQVLSQRLLSSFCAVYSVHVSKCCMTLSVPFPDRLSANQYDDYQVTSR